MQLVTGIGYKDFPSKCFQNCLTDFHKTRCGNCLPGCISHLKISACISRPDALAVYSGESFFPFLLLFHSCMSLFGCMSAKNMPLKLILIAKQILPNPPLFCTLFGCVLFCKGVDLSFMIDLADGLMSSVCLNVTERNPPAFTLLDVAQCRSVAIACGCCNSV